MPVVESELVVPVAVDVAFDIPQGSWIFERLACGWHFDAAIPDSTRAGCSNPEVVAEVHP